MSLTIQIEDKELKSVWGGKDFLITATVVHTVDSVVNTYTVAAKVEIFDFMAELNFREVLGYGNKSNEETLADEAILALCNDEKY